MANVPLKPAPTGSKIAKADKVIVYGDGGVGKSHSIASILIDAPDDTRLIYLMTDRNAASGFENGLKTFNITPKEGQVIYVMPKQKTKAFNDLNRALKDFVKESKVNALKGKADTTQGKEHYTYLQDVINSLVNFVGIDYVTGEEVTIGNVGELSLSDILVVDGLSPIGNEVWHSTVGDKIAISQTDYMPAQHLMYQILSQLSILECPVVLLAHEKPFTDDKGNLIQARVNTCVGNSNYATLMGLFTDVIHATTLGPAYRWEISNPRAYAISRRIPKGTSNIEPNFTKYGFFK